MIRKLFRTAEQVVTLPIRLTFGAVSGVTNAAGEFVEDLVIIFTRAPKPAGETWYDDADRDYAAELIAAADTEPSRCLHCGLFDCAGQCPPDLLDGAVFYKREVEEGHTYESTYGPAGVYVTRDGLPHMSITTHKGATA